jgi:hypothetical protein
MNRISGKVAIPLLSALAILLAIGAAVPVAKAQWGGTSSGEMRVRCDSPGGRDRFCPAANDGRVRLLRSYGGAPCVEGQTWRHDRGGIYVRGGCIGEFGYVNYSGGGGGGWGNDGSSGQVEIRCESDDGRENFCAVDNREVRLQRTLSRAPCVEGQSWRRDRRGVYVRNGCRGLFVAFTSGGGGWGGGNTGGGWGNGGGGGWGGGGGGNWGGAQTVQIKCQSIGGRWGACPVDIHGEVRLVRKESHADCIRNWTWGNLRNEAIWVSNGCRAVFEVRGSYAAGRSIMDGPGDAPPGVMREAPGARRDGASLE